MNFKEISIDELNFNPFTKIGKEWFLVTAGDKESFNTMTAAWGSLGIYWNKPVFNILVRPTRYTYEFTEKNDNFTVSFLAEEFREAYKICGTKSGRDTNKVKESGLTPFELLEGTVAFKEAELVFVCKKIYTEDFNPANFLEQEIENSYPEKDYHRVYTGEIKKIYFKA